MVLVNAWRSSTSLLSRRSALHSRPWVSTGRQLAIRRVAITGTRRYSSEGGQQVRSRVRHSGAFIAATAGFGLAGIATLTYASASNDTGHTQCEPSFLGGDVLKPTFIADAVEVAVPALVNITSKITDPFGRQGQTAGSGFIIDSSGLVATNAHVVRQSSELKLTLYDGRELRGKVHSVDLATDLALVQITDTLSEKLPVMEIGCSASLRPGEFVIALGSPLNMSNTVTAGIVSSVARQASELGVTQKRTDYIQTDAAINQGNSGGPLINLKGEVIGINTMKVAGTGGIGFAIPIDTAWIVLSQLKENRKVVRPYLGLKMFRLTPEIVSREKYLARSFPNVTSGVMVVKVNPHSPADEAGIKSGDVITSMDGKQIKTINDITNIMGFEIGKTHEIGVIRKQQQKTFYVKTTPVTLK